MKYILTGGAGDLGQLLYQDLRQNGHEVRILDMAEKPRAMAACDYLRGSLTDRADCRTAAVGRDILIHIAALHGIHEDQGCDAYDFHDVNVTGTFNIFQAAAEAGIRKVILISSTSVDDRYGLYGHTKILNEEMARAYAARHDMDIIVLRPRAFIPPWNRCVYDDFIGWANWFVKGAVHIQDVKQAVLKAAEHLKNHTLEDVPILPVDGAYEYTSDDLVNWNDETPSRTYGPERIQLAEGAGIDIRRKPKVIGHTDAFQKIEYQPKYSLKNLLDDFETYGAAGPPNPAEFRKSGDL